MTVFVLQKDDKKDFSAAEKFGDLQFLWGVRRGIYPDNADTRVDTMVSTARKALEKFDVEKDYLLLVGDPIGISIVSALLGEMSDTIPVLKWDGQAQQYYPVTINLEDLTN